MDARVTPPPAADTSGLFAQVAFNRLLDLRREFAEGGDLVAKAMGTFKYVNP